MTASNMLSMTVLDNVRVFEGLEDLQLGVELVLLLVGHTAVRYLFPA